MRPHRLTLDSYRPQRPLGILKSARHETFAQAWARTKSATEACLEIKMDPRNSTRLTKNDEIRRRVDELLARGAERTVVTLESLIREADEIQRAASANMKYSAAVLALIAKAKLAGLWVERSVNGNTNAVYAISDEPMSHKEWVAKFTKGRLNMRSAYETTSTTRAQRGFAFAAG